MARAAVASALLVSWMVGAAAPASAYDETWQRIGTGITGGVSGLAPHVGGWAVVRDNKLAGQNRLSLIDDSGVVTPVSWPGTAPVDLESLSAVPGAAGTFVAVTSKGKGTVFALSGASMSIQRTIATPRGTSNVEGFALTDVGGTIVAVWATRGSPTAAAKVFAATFDPGTGVFGRVVSRTVTVPYPTVAVRHVSDLTVVAGRVVVSSASDPGNNGPFDSALYDVGTVGLVSGRAALTLVGPVSLGTFPGHKVEGIACSGGTGLVGSDDENLGGWVRTSAFCG